MASISITMTAPASVGQGISVQFRDGSSTTVGAYGITSVPAQFVKDMLDAGWQLFGQPSVANGVAADSNANQANATPLPAQYNRVTSAPAANAGVLLPKSAPGLRVRVSNANSGNQISVFPAANDAINSAAANAAHLVAANKTAEYSCSVAGAWDVILSS